VLVYALAAAVALVAVAALLVRQAGRRRARALAEEVRRHVEPYLRRKAAEQGVAAETPTWTSRSTPDEIIAWSARTAARLLAREKKGPSQKHEAIGYEETQPVDISDEIVVTAPKPHP
jgi:hypothetical protein